MFERLRMSIFECISVYFIMSEKMFERLQNFIHCEKFDFQILEKTIKMIVKQKIDNQIALLQDFVDCKT